MGVLSSIFGSQPAQPVVGAQPLSVTEIPEQLKPYYTDILSKAQALYNKRTDEGYTPYEGPTIAPYSPEQEQAFTGIAALQGGTAPKYAEAEQMTRDAASGITGAQIQEAMSPYQQAVTDIEKRESQKSFEQNVLPKLRAAQVAQGSFGGTRGTLLEAQSLGEQQKLLSDIQTKGSQAAFADARAALDAERTRQGQASTNLANIAGAGFKTGLAELGAQQGVGEVKQQQTQAALDEAYRQFLQEKDEPYAAMQKYQQVVSGAPISTTTYAPPPPPQPSLGQQLIGGLAGVGSLYGTFTGKPIFGEGKTGGGIAGLVKRATPGQVGTPANYKPIDLPSLDTLIQDEYTPVNYAALEKAGLAATRQAATNRQEALRQQGDLTQAQITALQKGTSDPAFTREQNLYNAILGAAFDENVTGAGSGVGKILTGIGKTATSYKKLEDEEKAKRLKATTDINQLKMNLIDAQSKGDMEAVKAITDQINAISKSAATRAAAQKTRTEKEPLSTTDKKKILLDASGIKYDLDNETGKITYDTATYANTVSVIGNATQDMITKAKNKSGDITINVDGKNYTFNTEEDFNLPKGKTLADYSNVGTRYKETQDTIIRKVVQRILKENPDLKKNKDNNEDNAPVGTPGGKKKENNINPELMPG